MKCKFVWPIMVWLWTCCITNLKDTSFLTSLLFYSKWRNIFVDHLTSCSSGVILTVDSLLLCCSCSTTFLYNSSKSTTWNLKIINRHLNLISDSHFSIPSWTPHNGGHPGLGKSSWSKGRTCLGKWMQFYIIENF